ncbi:hypothetical protein LCGC14_3077840, partial [marine sediment metagenome]
MKLIKLNNKNLFTKVDDCDYEWLSQWKWVAKLIRKGERIYAVRGKASAIIMAREIMKAPKGLVVDHINHDTLDKDSLSFYESFGFEHGRTCMLL